MYETFEHTADLGLRIKAADLNGLFEEAAQALFATIVENLGTVQSVTQINITLEGTDLEYLLFDWLNKLLYYFDADHLLFGRFAVHTHKDGLTASAWGETLDRSRHNMEHEVKAITYHGLKVEQNADGWLAEVIVDI